MPTARESLLNAALAALDELPWSGVRMVDVASAAGVSRQTLYNEFGSKDGLARALIRREAEAYLQGVERLLSDRLGHGPPGRGSAPWPPDRIRAPEPPRPGTRPGAPAPPGTTPGVLPASAAAQGGAASGAVPPPGGARAPGVPPEPGAASAPGAGRPPVAPHPAGAAPAPGEAPAHGGAVPAEGPPPPGVRPGRGALARVASGPPGPSWPLPRGGEPVERLVAVVEWTVGEARARPLLRALLTGCWGDRLPAPPPAGFAGLAGSAAGAPAQRRADAGPPAPRDVIAAVRDRSLAALERGRQHGRTTEESADLADRCELAVRLALSYVVAPGGDMTGRVSAGDGRGDQGSGTAGTGAEGIGPLVRAAIGARGDRSGPPEPSAPATTRVPSGTDPTDPGTPGNPGCPGFGGPGNPCGPRALDGPDGPCDPGAPDGPDGPGDPDGPGAPDGLSGPSPTAGGR
ncbi:TetR family transcriptional regulator [Streptomyces sp. NPDC004609]|uniref:TetR/AcrR family transcriptional regulator n=1 Tax=Streptomyces sp. NPDC004609 TaxID=3364704 RepID=UPI0036C7293D